MKYLFAGLTGAMTICLAGPAMAQEEAGTHPGEAVYQQNCAMCHDHPEQTRAPGKDALAAFSVDRIHESMVSGLMKIQASALSPEQKLAVAEYLGAEVVAEADWTEAMACPADRAGVELDMAPTVAGFGFDLENSRHLDYDATGLVAEDFANLELAWAIGFPNAVSMRSQAAVVGDTMFLPVGESGGRMFAFDISEETPCIQWVYETEDLRSSAAYSELSDGTKALFVGDRTGFVHAVNALTGELIWKKFGGLSEGSAITGTPVVANDRVYVPVSQFEITYGAQDAYECCKLHGGVVAMNGLTGERLWEMHTMPAAEPVRDRGDGQMLWGPSGAPIWNSPSIDLERGQLYVGTGEATSPPAHRNTDALIAVDLEDGHERWSFQATENDIFLSACRPGTKLLNCVPSDETVYRDVDFGASTIIATTESGRDLVLGGQKSGTVWAMDADTGDVVWRRDIGTGTRLGGIHWGLAADNTHVYAPISLPGSSLPEQDVPDYIKPGLYAVNLETGEIDWSFYAEPECAEESKKFTPRCQFMFGLSGAPTIIGDYVVTGGLDGTLYVIDKASGELVWRYHTARAFETLNGVEAKGAAIDNASIVAKNGMLFVNSGYGLFGAGAGNVMLAFRPKTD